MPARPQAWGTGDLRELRKGVVQKRLFRPPDKEVT